jgi:hypothetical protein
MPAPPSVSRRWSPDRHPQTLRTAGALALALALVLSNGCGYALAGRGSFLPSYIRTIGIPLIENRTAHPLHEIVTEKIRAEFIGRGKYQVISEAVGADAVLRGEITSVALQTVGLTEQQLGSRYLVTMVMKMTLTDSRNDEVLWANDALTFREEYDLGTRSGADGAVFLDQQGTSLERMATDVARTIVTAITEAF